jgi:N-carbamoylputrescine amidase
MAERKLTIGLVQMRCDADRDTNLRRAIDYIEIAAGRGASLICLPELFLSPYFCKTEDHSNFDLAEAIPGPTTSELEPVARRLGVSIIASLFERRAPGLYHNTAAFIGPDGYQGMYRKMHIPDDPLFYEKFYFTPGDLGFKVFDVPETRVGTLICWDQWYPEAARLTAMQGASVLFYPTAIGWLPDEKDERGDAQHESWELIQRSHAIANGCFVAAVNRIGFEAAPDSENGIEFWGQSFVCGPDGAIIDRASSDEEEVLVVDLDLNRLDTQRTEWPFLRDRRIDAYEPITRRYLDSE